MNMRAPKRDGGGPSLAGGVVLAVFVAVNLAAGPDALEGSLTRAAEAGRSTARSLVRSAADLAIRYGAGVGDDGREPPESCPPWAKPHHGAGPMKARACEMRIRCGHRLQDRDGDVTIEWRAPRPWTCRSPS
jgi:hypothetical protein